VSEYQIGDVVALKNNRLVPRWVIDHIDSEWDAVSELEINQKLHVISLDSQARTRVVSAWNVELLERGN